MSTSVRYGTPPNVSPIPRLGGGGISIRAEGFTSKQTCYKLRFDGMLSVCVALHLRGYRHDIHHKTRPDTHFAECLLCCADTHVRDSIMTNRIEST